DTRHTSHSSDFSPFFFRPAFRGFRAGIAFSFDSTTSPASSGSSPAAPPRPPCRDRKSSLIGTSANGSWSRKCFNRYRRYTSSNSSGPLVNSTIVGGSVATCDAKYTFGSRFPFRLGGVLFRGWLPHRVPCPAG